MNCLGTEGGQVIVSQTLGDLPRHSDGVYADINGVAEVLCIAHGREHDLESYP